MFDNFKNLANLPGLMSKAKEMQDRMKTLQEELALRQHVGDAGDGRVTATVDGRLGLVRIKIDKDRTDTGNTELLETLVTAAVTSAQAKAVMTMRDEMMKMSTELGLPPGALPGMG